MRLTRCSAQMFKRLNEAFILRARYFILHLEGKHGIIRRLLLSDIGTVMHSPLCFISRFINSLYKWALWTDSWSSVFLFFFLKNLGTAGSRNWSFLFPESVVKNLQQSTWIETTIMNQNLLFWLNYPHFTTDVYLKRGLLSHYGR